MSIIIYCCITHSRKLSGLRHSMKHRVWVSGIQTGDQGMICLFSMILGTHLGREVLVTHKPWLESSGDFSAHRCAGYPGMTQRPNSAAILDWSPEHLGLASLCGLGFSQYGGWVLRGISRGNFRKVVNPREPGRSSLTFYELTSESTLYHFCYALLFKTATRLFRFNRKEPYTPPFSGRNIKELEGQVKNVYLARIFCMTYTVYSYMHTHTHTHTYI